MKNLFLIFSFLIFSNLTCYRPAVSNIEEIPVVEERDKPFADVYRMLDGTWKGKFKIYEDSNPVPKNQMDLINLTLANVTRPELKLLDELEVTQNYQSETPYFQKVKIEDFYPKTGKRESSIGVNKVQQGKMWCVVKKSNSNEPAIHVGTLRDKETIIWESMPGDKSKIEFFQETVSEDVYEIIGYGYYGDFNKDMTPKLWFYGKYERQ